MSIAPLRTLEELRCANWFANVGVVDSDAVLQLKSWKSAIASGQSREWENLRLHEDNRLREYLDMRFPDRLSQWNEIVERWKPHVEALVAEILDRCRASGVVPEPYASQLVDELHWDLLGLCTEVEYRDIDKPPRFYHKLADWYLSGHYPCGWNGVYPNGNLVIY